MTTDQPDRHKNAFSLVELVIVVVIIGIIAAIAVPRMSSSAGQSRETSLIATLSGFRSAIDRYAAEHGGTLPGANPDGSGGAANSAEAFSSQLLMYTDNDGIVSLTKDSTYLFGPYLRNISPISVGPNQGTNEVAIDTANSPPLVTGGPEAWVYNPATGMIIANTDDANLAGSRAYDEY